MKAKAPRRAGPAERARYAGDDGPAPEGSEGRGQSAVLWLLRGEDLELVSRELGVTAAKLSAWRDAFWPRARPRSRPGRPTVGTSRSVL